MFEEVLSINTTSINYVPLPSYYLDNESAFCSVCVLFALFAVRACTSLVFFVCSLDLSKDV